MRKNETHHGFHWCCRGRITLPLILLALNGLIASCAVKSTVDEDEVAAIGTRTFSLFAVQEDLDAAFNIIFYADIDEFGDLEELNDLGEPENREEFVETIATLVETGFWENEVFFMNLAHFNFFYSLDTADAVASANQTCPELIWPDSRDNDGIVADMTMVIHRDADIRDCAFIHGRYASANANTRSIAVHESAHALFALPDEYCCDGGYYAWEPIMYETENDCLVDPVNLDWRLCVSFQESDDEDGNPGDIFWRSEGHIHTSVMKTVAPEVFEFGPADWVAIDSSLRALPNVTSTIAPTTFAPDNWVRFIP